METQSARDQHQVADLRLGPVLDPLDRAAVDAGQLSELFLSELEM